MVNPAFSGPPQLEFKVPRPASVGRACFIESLCSAQDLLAELRCSVELIRAGLLQSRAVLCRLGVTAKKMHYERLETAKEKKSRPGRSYFATTGVNVVLVLLEQIFVRRYHSSPDSA